MTNNAQKISDMLHSNALVSSLLGILITVVGAMGSYFISELRQNRDTEEYRLRMEEQKLQKIFEINTGVFKLNAKVDDIDQKVAEGKKKTEYILKRVNDKIDIINKYNNATCSDIIQISEMYKWPYKPKCSDK